MVTICKTRNNLTINLVLMGLGPGIAAGKEKSYGYRSPSINPAMVYPSNTKKGDYFTKQLALNYIAFNHPQFRPYAFIQYLLVEFTELTTQHLDWCLNIELIEATLITECDTTPSSLLPTLLSSVSIGWGVFYGGGVIYFNGHLLMMI